MTDESKETRARSRVVTFARAFDYRPGVNLLIAYPAGWTGRVPGAHAAAAEAAGALVTDKPAP